MTDRTKRGQSDSWLEKELTKQLCPVSAPDSLWQQIHEQRRPLRVRSPRVPVWSVVVVIALATFSAGEFGLLALVHDQTADLQKLSARELRALENGSAHLEIHSGNPSEVRRWVMKNAGIDIQLPERQTGEQEAVRLLGARLLVVNGTPIAALTYRMGQEFAAMLVEGRSGGRKLRRRLEHTTPHNDFAGDSRFLSWNMGDDLYTTALAKSVDANLACQLCHAAPAGLLAFN